MRRRQDKQAGGCYMYRRGWPKGYRACTDRLHRFESLAEALAHIEAKRDNPQSPKYTFPGEYILVDADRRRHTIPC
jgi:hypothetical protein